LVFDILLNVAIETFRQRHMERMGLQPLTANARELISSDGLNAELVATL